MKLIYLRNELRQEKHFFTASNFLIRVSIYFRKLIAFKYYLFCLSINFTLLKLRCFKYYLFCLYINFTLLKLRCFKYYLFCLYINLIILHGDNIFFMALLFVYVKVTLYSLKKQAKYHFYLKRKIGGRLTILVLHQYSILFINYLLNDCVLKLKFKFEINNVVHNKEQLKR